MRFGKICAAAVLAIGMAGAARADVLLDQIEDGTALGDPAASQRFQVDLATYDTGFVDDFTVAGSKYQVDTVSAAMGFFQGDGGTHFDAIQSYAVEIYWSKTAAGSNLTGNVASTTIAPGAASVQDGIVTLDLSTAGIVLDPGTYFLSVIPRMDFDTTNGQVGVRWTLLGNQDAFQANPAGAFGFTDGVSDVGASAAYRLEASPVAPAAVPLPASAWGGAALLGILGVRRMKRAAVTA